MFVIASLLFAILFILILDKILVRKNLAKEKPMIKNSDQEFENIQTKPDYDKLLRINKSLKKSLQELKKVKEKAEENDRLKSTFLANMSHEIRTPMNAIIGFSNLLLKENISDENKKEFVRLIIENGNSLLNLINDIIDISKIEAEQLKINLTKCNLTELLKDLYLYYNDLIKRSKRLNIKIELVLPSNPKRGDVYIFSDPYRLRQILSNLINNAIKFTFEGKIEFGFCKNNGSVTKFFVKDTGIGIAKDKLNSVFRRFEQIGNAYTKSDNGSGLGLSISKQLVELLGGTIRVKSKEGAGATFYFTVPSGKPGIEEFTNFKYDSKHPGFYNWSNKAILIAEDEKTNYIYLKTILSKTNVRLYWAENGSDAVDLCKRKNVNLVLMDIRMPGMSGYEATQKIKSMYPDIPVIAQTAYAMSEDIDKFIKAGCTDYIVKPIKSTELLALIDKNLQKVESTLV